MTFLRNVRIVVHTGTFFLTQITSLLPTIKTVCTKIIYKFTDLLLIHWRASRPGNIILKCPAVDLVNVRLKSYVNRGLIRSTVQYSPLKFNKVIDTTIL